MACHRLPVYIQAAIPCAPAASAPQPMPALNHQPSSCRSFTSWSGSSYSSPGTAVGHSNSPATLANLPVIAHCETNHPVFCRLSCAYSNGSQAPGSTSTPHLLSRPLIACRPHLCTIANPARHIMSARQSALVLGRRLLLQGLAQHQPSGQGLPALQQAAGQPSCYGASFVRTDASASTSQPQVRVGCNQTPHIAVAASFVVWVQGPCCTSCMIKIAAAHDPAAAAADAAIA